MTAKFRQSFKSYSVPKSVIRWFDSDYELENMAAGQTAEKSVDWLRVLPFAFLHLMCLAVIWVGWSWTAVTVAFVLYLIRMFAITGFYHRYFSHKTFATNRFWQFLFAVLGNASVQRGPLWWASHHRHHHRFTDKIEDAHSPTQYGFWWSHMGWLTSRKNFPTKMKYVRDWARYPELVWINRFDTVIPVLLAVFLFLGGVILAKVAPALNTNGMQMLIWGFFISTAVHFHATVTINSLAHMVGRRRYDTPDTSRNNFLLAIITLGEGWHNNHHHYPISARQGFFWWEIDPTYWGLRLLCRLGIIRDLRPLPEKVKDQNRVAAGVQNG